MMPCRRWWTDRLDDVLAVALLLGIAAGSWTYCTGELRNVRRPSHPGAITHEDKLLSESRLQYPSIERVRTRRIVSIQVEGNEDAGSTCAFSATASGACVEHEWTVLLHEGACEVRYGTKEGEQNRSDMKGPVR